MFLIIIVTLQTILITQQKETGDGMRSCVMQAVSSNKKCTSQYKQCFLDINCNNQFEDLFTNCSIKPGNQIYENECINEAFININNLLLQDLFDCLVRQCNIIQGRIPKKTKETNISLCLSNALVDSSKCWIIAKDCQSDSCVQSLNQFQECDSFIEKNDLNKTKQCLEQKQIQDQQGKLIQQCLLNQCF